jgi:hypothetical protein
LLDLLTFVQSFGMGREFLFVLTLLFLMSVSYSEDVKILPGIVKNFVDYHLYFSTVGQPSLSCPLIFNSTDNELLSKITRSSRTAYISPTLRAKQVGWKKTEKAEVVNSSQPNISKTIPKKNTSEVVYEHMAFALLLPDHPYSSNLFEALKIISPMYPEVSVVFGNGYEFTEMCSQYNVRSFPKLLFFTHGNKS